MKLEIERKFLLKSIPSIVPLEKVKIDQYYYKNSDGIWERCRSWESDIKGTRYIHTVKKSISKGVNIEDEKDVSLKEFKKFKSKCLSGDVEARFISKERWIYPDGNLYWEVDIFNSGHHLIVAEIEIPTKNFKVDIPNFIKDKLLLEVTGLKQFSNRNLSNKI